MTSSIWIIMFPILIIYIFINFKFNKLKIYSGFFYYINIISFYNFPMGENES